MALEYRLVSSLEKVFPDGRGTNGESPCLSALRGESISFQLAVKNIPEKFDEDGQFYVPKVISPLEPYITIRSVQSVPVRMERPETFGDAGYISTKPGLYPDVLETLGGEYVCFAYGQWRSLWMEIAVPATQATGKYPLSVVLLDIQQKEAARIDTQVEIIPAVLPAQTIKHTEWFYADCLADYYQVPVFSEKHWQIVEDFVRTAVKRGCTMLLTPHFTPPLDTWIGGERTTVQLVDVYAQGEQYRFCFERLKRWIDMAFRCGIEQIEFSHLFTQWGANAAPKIMVWEDGKLVRRFGWDTPAVGGAYTAFLRQYLPALIHTLREWGIDKRCCFHISDEPTPARLATYQKAKESVDDLLTGYEIMDALSAHEIFSETKLATPVVSIFHLQDFWDHDVNSLWTYYYCAAPKKHINRSIQMPLARVRMLGFVLWKYQIRGFLHWGYNFYNSTQSYYPINPYLDTEGSTSYFPAGDPFVVYPGRNGQPEESIRLIALHSAFQDVRALSLLEELIGREKALQILEEDGEITLTQYPYEGDALLKIRQRINEAIAAATSAAP